MHDIENLTKNFYKNPYESDGYEEVFSVGTMFGDKVAWWVDLLMPLSF